MEKLTFKEARNKIDEHNKASNIKSQYSDKNALKLNIVYSQENWDKQYTEKERTYQVRSDEKYFLPTMCGSSLYGNCLDGKDIGVRLDWQNWKIEYCYFN